MYLCVLRPGPIYTGLRYTIANGDRAFHGLIVRNPRVSLPLVVRVDSGIQNSAFRFDDEAS